MNARTAPAVLRRLATDIHQRAYHDAGIEVLPLPAGPDGTQAYRLGRPHCKKGDHDFGTLSWAALSAAGVPDQRAVWSSDELRSAVFAQLGAERWRTLDHKMCFHRRGKARYGLVFAVAAELVDTASLAEHVPRAQMTAVTHGDGLHGPMLELIAEAGFEVPPGPARHLGIRCCGRPMAVLRTDGLAMSAGGQADLADLWWRGADVGALAAAVSELAGHHHAGAGVAAGWSLV